MLNLLAGMTALSTMLVEMRAEETGVAPEETLAELGRRVQELLSGSGWTCGLFCSVGLCLVHRSIRQPAKVEANSSYL